MPEHSNPAHDAWQEAVAREYRSVVSDAEPGAGVQRADAFAMAAARIDRKVRAGDLHVPHLEAIYAALERADRLDGAKADTVLRQMMRGELTLNVEDDPKLDLVVVLGGGRRKPWRYVTRFDLLEMDRLRWGNVRHVQVAYDEWREGYDRLLPLLDEHETVGAVCASGLLVPVGVAA